MFEQYCIHVTSNQFDVLNATEITDPCTQGSLYNNTLIGYWLEVQLA